MDVPSTVEAETAFLAEITFQNNGTEPWDAVTHLSLAPKLVSKSPDNNTTWGTNFIILGQGFVIDPGESHTFTSYLLAPSATGNTDFQWRPFSQYDINSQFGDSSTLTTINVTANTSPPYSPPPTPPPVNSRRALTEADLTYVGSFLPSAPNTSTNFSEIGLALCIRGGTRTLIINFNFGSSPNVGVNEISIPTLVEWDGTAGGVSALNTATQVRHWGVIDNSGSGATGDDLMWPNGGLYFDDSTKNLWWTSYNSYWTGGQLPVLNCTTLNDDETTDWVGTWRIPNQKYYWGGVTRLSQDWADVYSSGDTLALGFGGEFSGTITACSRGPCVCVLPDPTPDVGIGTISSVTRLLDYDEATEAAFRVGNAFYANVGYWNTQPTSSDRGVWGAWDDSRAGVMVYLADVRGFIAFANLGTGRQGYDYAAGTWAGNEIDLYLYDPDEMGDGAGGSGSHALVPYERVRDLFPLDVGLGTVALGSPFRGVCIDEGNRLIYVARSGAYSTGVEWAPLIHVFYIEEAP